MRLGIIGAGAIARRHLDALRRRSDVAVTAVCDLDGLRAAELAGDAGARALTSWADLVDAPDVDAVLVCTPPGSHADPAVAALERGLPVYLEKPLARSEQDGERIVRAWRQSGIVCAVGYQWRALRVLGPLRDALGGATPGLLVSRSFGPTEPGRGDLAAAEGSWFADRRASGGILFELGSHDIDLQVALAGPASRVHAAGRSGLLALSGRGADDLEDAVAVVIEFVSGALGVVCVAWNPAAEPPVYTLDVEAGGASLHLQLDPVFRLTGAAAGRDIDERDEDDPRQSSIDRFLDAARSGDPSAVPCSPADALETLRAALAAERAIESSNS